jgi:phosphatidylethanolamine-binding protein (PEBP) family uncharacterized protein
MKLTSPAFDQNQPIPAQYTCDGVNHHPPLSFSEVPEEARSLALVVEDPDAPAKAFTHWLIYPFNTAHPRAGGSTAEYGRDERFWHTWL